MTKVEENKFSMFGDTAAVLNNYGDVVSAFPALEDAASRFINKKGDIDAKNQELETLGVSKALVKAEARANVEASMKDLGACLISYAAVNHHLELFGQGKALLKRLSHVRDTVVSVRASTLVELLNGSLAALAGFGVTAGKVTALQSRAAAYSAAMADQGATFATRKTARAELKQLFKETMQLLTGEVDLLVDTLKNTQPAFYSDYWNARNIKDLGVRHRKEEVTE